MAEGDAAATVASSGSTGIGRGLGTKLGPFPVWAWVLGVGGIGAAVYFLILKPAAGGGGGGIDTGQLAPGLFAGGGGTPSGTSTTSAAPALTNQAWLTTAATSVSSSLGLPLSEVTQYLNWYLLGQQPGGNTQAQSTFWNVITTAIQAAGQPPQPVPTGTTSPFTSQSAWISALLGAIPNGTSQSAINEIINLTNGATSTISQDAANALTAAENIIGLGPTPISYTITGTTTTTPPPTTGTGIPNLTQALINTWQNLYLSLPTSQQTYTQWVATAPSAVTAAFSPATLTSIYNYFNTAAGQSAVASAGGALNWLNNYYTNPTPLPGPSSTRTA